MLEDVDLLQREKVEQGHLRRVKLVTRLKLYGRNFITVINA